MIAARLLARLHNREDALVERKPDGPSGDEIRATACGFANTVTPGSTGVIFFGVADDGVLLGVADTDRLQKRIRRQLTVECYPPVTYQSHVLEENGMAVVAVEIPASDHRPHFSGPAYVRQGSETVAASAQEFERLIASRNTVAGVLVRAIGQTWSVTTVGKWLGQPGPAHGRVMSKIAECRIDEVTAHFVRLHHASSGTNITESLTRAEITHDEWNHRPMLVFRG
jgi:schlafen family protein